MGIARYSVSQDTHSKCPLFTKRVVIQVGRRRAVNALDIVRRVFDSLTTHHKRGHRLTVDRRIPNPRVEVQFLVAPPYWEVA